MPELIFGQGAPEEARGIARTNLWSRSPHATTGNRWTVEQLSRRWVNIPTLHKVLKAKYTERIGITSLQWNSEEPCSVPELISGDAVLQ